MQYAVCKMQVVLANERSIPVEISIHCTSNRKMDTKALGRCAIHHRELERQEVDSKAYEIIPRLFLRRAPGRCATQEDTLLSGTKNSILCLASDLRVSHIGDLWVEVSSAVQRDNPRIEVCAMKAIKSSRELTSNALMTVTTYRPLVNCSPNTASRSEIMRPRTLVSSEVA